MTASVEGYVPNATVGWAAESVIALPAGLSWLRPLGPELHSDCRSPSAAEAHHLNTRQRLAMMAKICEAVRPAHQRGLIHRDLKPGNILVDETAQPRILDFGVVHMTGSDAQTTRHTNLGQIVGTLAYMSPEQVLSDPGELDVRSDVYSLGVILYELLAGRLPLNISQKVHEAVQTIREVDPAPLSSVKRRYRGDIETIVAKALEKDKARRYGSAADLAEDIWRYLRDEPIFSKDLDKEVVAMGVRVLRTPVRAPQANSVCVSASSAPYAASAWII
jgi:serine/threonine protein kinase